jgi:hypothetical protein
MRVNGINSQIGAASNCARPAVRHASASEAAKASNSESSCRALIPLSPVRSSAHAQTVVRQPVNFLAHLIATEQALPQTRERRRAEPNVATAIYGTARAPVLSGAGHAISRAI